jgi:hypothetical protein
MQDTCVILSRSTAGDAYGWPVETWSDGTTTVCGFDPDPKEEGMDESQVPRFDAMLRLPLARESLITGSARVKITKRYGVTLSTQPVYEVVSGPDRGPSGLVVKLEKVTDGS